MKYDREEANEIIVEQSEEIERLNKNNQAMQEEMARTWKKLDKEENIIKEAREYLKLREDDNSMCSVCGVMSERILEILDKVEEKI